MTRLTMLPTLLLATPAAADTLPLLRGAYVQRDAACRDAPNAVLRDYNGQGIGSSRAGRCTGQVLAQVGRRYTLRQSCVQYGGPDRRRAVERVKLRVDARDAFTDLRTRTAYRRCAGLRL